MDLWHHLKRWLWRLPPEEREAARKKLGKEIHRIEARRHAVKNGTPKGRPALKGD